MTDVDNRLVANTRWGASFFSAPKVIALILQCSVGVHFGFGKMVSHMPARLALADLD